VSSQSTSPERTRAPIGDKLFAGAARGAGIAILVALGAVFAFLLIKGLPGFNVSTEFYGGHSNFWSFVWPLLFGTVLIAALALVIAVPFAIAIALFITYYAPKKLAAPVAYVIDLLAAIPSIVYGLFGGLTLAQALLPTYTWVAKHLNWIPIFKGASTNGNGTVAAAGAVAFTAVIVLAVMVLPIITAIAREVFAQTPKLQQEAALGLGATRWELIRLAVLPHAKSGIIAGVMLGLGRALGETMAVFMVAKTAAPVVNWDLIGQTSPTTIAAYIANNFASETSSDDARAVLIAAGLMLFVLTFAVNFIARWVIARGEKAAR
jgi:phosphate transport system permease protein